MDTVRHYTTGRSLDTGVWWRHAVLYLSMTAPPQTQRGAIWGASRVIDYWMDLFEYGYGRFLYWKMLPSFGARDEKQAARTKGAGG